MRKALIGMILAASAMTPAAVQAQSDPNPILERYQRVGERNHARVEARQERREAVQERRQERREAVREQRQERREAVRERRRMDAAPPPGAVHRDRYGRIDVIRERYERVGRENRRNYERKIDERQRDEERRHEWRERIGDRRNWDRGWRHDRRYDWQRWRYSNRHHYRLPPYYAPHRGHRYSRFGIGIHIGRPFYDQRYWIQDPWQYRLPHAPVGYQWVRYYDDVLLIDTWSGEVVDVIYDFFW